MHNPSSRQNVVIVVPLLLLLLLLLLYTTKFSPQPCGIEIKFVLLSEVSNPKNKKIKY